MRIPERQNEIRSQEQSFHDGSVRLVKALAVLLASVPFAACWYGYYSMQIFLDPSHIRSAGIVLMFVVLYTFFGRAYDAFQLSFKRSFGLFCSQTLAVFMADGFMYIVLWLMSGAFPFLPPALAALAGQLVLSALWCKFANNWYFDKFGGARMGIIYNTRQDIDEMPDINFASFGGHGSNRKFDVQFACSADECFAADMRNLDGLDTVFLCGVHSHERNMIMKYCVANKISVYLIPRIGDVIMGGAKRVHMFHLPVMCVGSYSPPIEYAVAKRFFDIVASLIGIVLTSPIMLVVAIAIKACDGGPVLYKQVRLTKDGKEFNILKFRSMRTDAEKDGVARLSTGTNDDRVTPVGRVIRACRVDELPQLFNILGGSMSMVGPRPERPEIAAQYEEEMPEFRLRLQAKAGLTGYAQVYGKYNTIPYYKLQMDLMYIANPSILEDLSIIFATIKVLLMKDSTEGVAAGQTTAADKERSEEMSHV